MTDTERLDFLIAEAYYLGTENKELNQEIVALVIAHHIKHPESVRDAIDRAMEYTKPTNNAIVGGGSALLL